MSGSDIADKKLICPDYEEDSVFFNGKKRTVCSFWNLSKHGLCNHDNHSVCKFYMIQNKIEDPFVQNLMEEFSLTLVKEEDFPKNFRGISG